MPPPTASKRITSAPSWARVMPPRGAATKAEPSTTRRPSRGAGSLKVAVLVMSLGPYGARIVAPSWTRRRADAPRGLGPPDLGDVAHRAAGGRGGERGVGLERERHLPLPIGGGPGVVAACLL